MEHSSVLPRLVRFDTSEVDLRSGELCREGLKTRLQEQPLQILMILVEHPGEVVTREMLQKRLWPDGTIVDFEHSINTAVKRLREAIGDDADTPRFIETLPRRGYRFIYPVDVAPSRIESIAVLPLENLSHDPQQEYFSDGLTDALTTSLGQIGALRVISRTSVMQYKGTKKPMPEIARELKVDTLVEGSVLRVGDRVRITAQLIDGVTDRHLWAQSYERDLGDVLGLQAEVASSIAREVQVKLKPQEATRFAKSRAVNPQAYEAYLRAKHTGDLKLFEEAIRLDPQFALPHAGLAGIYQFIWGFMAMRPPHEAYPKAEQAARHALSLDDTLSEAHAVLAMVQLEYNWNFPEAERELRRALELNPNSDYIGYGSIRHSYAHYLLHMGRLAESHAESERAVQISPFDMELRACVGWHCIFAREYDEAERHCREALRKEPNNFRAHMFLGWTYEQKQMFKEAVAEFKAANTAWNEPVLPTASLAHAYAISGRTREARRILTQLTNRSKRGYVSAYDIAVIYAGLGEPDRAFEWLDKAYSERSGFLIYFRADPRLDPLRSDERFQTLLRRIGLPP